MAEFFYFIDEDSRDRESYAKLLSTKDLPIKGLAPSKDLAGVIQRINAPGLIGVLLDYKLSISDPEIKYDASAIAAQIRSVRPDLPLVVLSGELVDPRNERSYRRTEELYDHRLDKADVANDVKRARRQLKSLASGYRRLRTLLGGEPDAKNIATAIGLRSANLPVVNWLLAESRGEAHRLAIAVVHLLLRVPGFLLPPRFAAVELGVDPDKSELLSRHADGALYAGVFEEMSNTPMYWADFIQTLKIPKGTPSARCRACGAPASTICEVCGDAFDGQHSISAQRLGVPPGFEAARVCGYCLSSPLPPKLAVRPESSDLVKSVIADTRHAKGAGRGESD
ncbi:MAG: hypothetical protein QOF78_2296 [Phycisphaerales bacterium]|jgi:hypothetical protein|nr:hypothetical protein [Phycisphaerales bacterium]